MNKNETKESLSTRMDVDAIVNRAKQIVADVYNQNREETDCYKMTKDDVYIVWFSKTLQNWKAMLSTTVSDGMYYEVTYNGDKKEAYVDSYKKWKNQCVED